MTTKTWASGNTFTSADANSYIRDEIVTCACVARANGTQGIANNTTTNVLWQTEDYDTDGMHSTASNTNLFTPTYSGIYVIQGAIELTNGSGGTIREVWVRKNGAGQYGIQAELYTVNGYWWDFDVHSVPVSMNGTTDNLELTVYHDQGTTLTINLGVVSIYRLRA